MMEGLTRTNQDNEQEQEYHVNSGFVNKLRSKFAQLENSGNKIVLSKRSASVENLLTDHGKATHDYASRYKSRQGSAGRSSNDDTILNSSRTSNVVLRKPTQGFNKKIERPNSHEGKNLIERPRSHESIHKSVEKSNVSKHKEIDYNFKQNNYGRGVKPPLPKKSEISSKRVSRNSSSSDYPISVPKIEHHDWTTAPDLEKVARDDIIIIEHTPSEKPDKAKEYSRDVTDYGAKPIKDKAEKEDELPKPHTVSAFRSFFEKANKAQETLRVWQGHSPTRKSAGSDVGSPRVTSPISSPRSPLEKVNDDNVFTQTVNNDSNLSTSTIASSISKSSVSKTSPRNSAEFVDTTPTSLEKSRQVFQTVDKSHEPSIGKDTLLGKVHHKDTNKIKDSAPSVTHTLTPLHSMSEVFDSKAMKKERPNRPKPVVLARKSKEFTSTNHVSEQHKPIPKDTIELKHEHDRQQLSKHDTNLEKSVDPSKTKDIINNKPIEVKRNSISKEIENEDVLNESLVKPSKKKSGKISPRKTKIFDSSNIKKKDRDPPKSPVSPVQSVFTFNESSTVTNNIEVTTVSKPLVNVVSTVNAVRDTKDEKEETQMEVSPVRPARSKKQNKVPSPGLTPLTTNIVKNDTKTHSDTRNSPRNNKSELVFPEPKKIEEQPERMKPETTSKTDDALVTGMSSFLAKQLKKSSADNSQLKTSSGHLANGSSPSPVPRKRQAPGRPVENGFIAQSNDVEMKDKEQIPPELPKTPEPKLPVSNIDEIIKRKKTTSQPSTKMVFDSSKIATKRKEPPKRKPPRKTLHELNENITFESPPVPRLDLSSITGEKQESEYQEGYIPTVIKPCNIRFKGEGVIPDKNPYKKTKRIKVKISFDDHATTTFEYEGEESALENYLQDHPEERDEVAKQEEEVNVSLQTTEELLNDSPRVPEPDTSALKSNPAIAASGALTSYKSKMQTQEFQFGMSLEPEEPVYDRREPDDEVNDDSMQLLPADDVDLDAFSAEVGKADMLF